MKTIQTYTFAWTLLLTSLVSCNMQNNENDENVAQLPTPITGYLTRAGASERPTSTYSINVTAKLPNGSNYLNGIASTMQTGTGIITFNGTTWYYPLNNSELRFYAHTGTASNDLLTLNSGTKVLNDVLLSNNGGKGTPGSAINQIRELDFSHIMTKLEVVVVVVDPAIDPILPPGWSPSKLQFTMKNVVGTGKYNITSASGANATNTGGSYTINMGTNYLVPTGATLDNKLLSLVIDNYTASAADLIKYTIKPNGLTPSIVLNPGMAYKLIFQIKQLHLDNIPLEGLTNTNITNDNMIINLNSIISQSTTIP